MLKQLPYDIIRYIIPFTYNPQPKKLLKELIQFHNSYKELKQIMLSEYTAVQVYDALWNWYLATYDSVHKIIYLSETDFIHYFHSNKIKTKIIALWAIFTKEDRDSFIMYWVDRHEAFPWRLPQISYYF